MESSDFPLAFEDRQGLLMKKKKHISQSELESYLGDMARF
jgi:hypothetical protein